MIHPVAFTIFGQAASKANSRKIVTIAGRPSVIKSAAARAFAADAWLQIPPAARLRLEGDVVVLLRIYYASRRPDLDETVVLDALQDRWAKPIKSKHDGRVLQERQLVQGGVYRNDRQVREKHVYWGLDPANPRVEVVVGLIEQPQGHLL